jgi:hypothetical protein
MIAGYELWRDTQPQVERCISGRLAAAGTSAQLPTETQFSRSSTSKQVYGTGQGSGVSPVFDGFTFGTRADLSGSGVSSPCFIDGIVSNNPAGGTSATLGEPLEPGTTYYYRLYIRNINGEMTPSDVLRVQTRAQRALFARNANGTLSSSCISPTSGTIAGGTSVTITGTGFTQGCVLKINGKVCTITSLSSTQLVVTTPGQTNASFVGRYLDVVLESPNGLKDIVLSGWRYT